MLAPQQSQFARPSLRRNSARCWASPIAGDPTMFKLILAPALIALMAVAPGLAAAEDAAAPHITVIGPGEVSATPDMAMVTLGVRERAKTAAEALAENSRSMVRVFDALAALGVAPRDIQTVSLSLNPIYRQVRVNDRNEQRQDGFQAANLVRVRLRDLQLVGPGLDALVKAGANQLHGVAFDITEKDALLDKARTAAIHDARRKAKLYADAAGVGVGPVMVISEATQGVVYPRVEMAMARDVGGPPVAEGEQTISATVTMVFAIDE